MPSSAAAEQHGWNTAGVELEEEGVGVLCTLHAIMVSIIKHDPLTLHVTISLYNCEAWKFSKAHHSTASRHSSLLRCTVAVPEPD